MAKKDILNRKDAAYEFLKQKYDVWDRMEKLFHNQLQSAITDNTRSHVFDPKLATLIIERAYRVMSQNPNGKVKGLSKNDAGGEKLMNMILEKYILPNANAQFDILTKLRMVDIYSNLYGAYFGLVDWDVKQNGYVGPDMWLLNIRDVFPQVGATSMEDSEYIIVRSWQPISYFERLGKQKDYKNISKVVKQLEKQSNPLKSDEDKSQRELSEYPEKEGVAGKGYYEILTMYERDKWTDYVVGADEIIREMDNPHDNGELPVIAKYSLPLIDDFMGMGDAERGENMQQVINSVWNLYLDAVKMSIYPPMAFNKNNIASPSSIRMAAGAKWMFRDSIANSVAPINLNPQGIATFNNTYQVAGASLLNMFGTTDTTVTQQTEAGFGKTPQALEMQAARENTRDNADRFYMEKFVTKMVKKMINLMAKKNTGKVAVRMFEEEIKELALEFPDVAEMYDENTGKLTIESKSFGNNLYDYEIISGSTYLVDQDTQQKSINSLIALIMNNPALMQQAVQSGEVILGNVKIKVGELMKRSIVNSGIQDWNKIVEEEKPEQVMERQIDNATEQFVQAVQQMEQGQMGQPQPNPQEVPIGGMNG